ncbi:MinD/ParA family ATP-binding protein [Halolamina sp. C58]|uniref:MinD/ParA family ATP-binding protein n=1 Tax=Halolamina sp. C58 TaxID=3421640 RepID=UPI003EBC3118
MLAIAGGKGGVGKTTTALGLAAALPDRPLVVDADCDMPDLHALAGVPADEGPHPCSAHDCRVLPTPADTPESVEQRLARLRSRESDGHTLVDTPAGAGVDAATPLRLADGIVLVSTACAPALRDAAKTASMARAVGTPVVGAVLTRTLARPPNAAELLGCPLLGVVPDAAGRPLDDRRVRERYEAAATALLDVTTSS